ncbi:DUF3397 domain-containing protein [Lysinibacillus sp. KU-BSD001]|uniref:DUF3397 domain-containing protein n=1 Tax=Lysinibacillus sp. KU-BSD001 TaxID=3141328 RepID=UPI0036E3C5A4
MKIFIEAVGGIILICPLVALILTFIICRKMRIKKIYAVGFAADVTTFILFFSVPLAFYSIWEKSLFLSIVIVALLIAISFTYIDWRTKKEIDVPILLKKIWRVYFILLSAMYLGAWVIGLSVNIMEYLAAP